MAKLIVITGRNVGTEYRLNGERLIMGRRSACPLPIADAKASREHAVILQRDGTYYLQDLSRNGTLLNGQPAEKKEGGAPLKYGDQIRIGDTILELIDQSKEPINIEIPGYDIIEKIGSGGMGIVFKARQRSMDRIVAMKVLNERYSSSAEFKDRFIREARAAGRLNHPNVIHVHDISSSNGRYYFSMEFIDGSSVKELLRIEQKMDVNQALDIVLQAAKALEFAHENRIVHRDIKPDNIMLTREGIVKIADLGIAKTFEDAAPSAKEHRRIMGTPHYMAPEQALGKAIDHRVDIYSLGATFYHMLTGNTPFSGSTAHEVLKAHIQESLPPIQDFNPNIPDPVCFIIERMMAKLPEKRYPDMSKVIEDIERVQRGVIAGIHRIESGDSTILRAMRAKSQKLQTPENAAEDAATSAHTPVSVGRIALLVALVFAAGVAIVLVVSKYVSKENVPIAANTSTGASMDTKVEPQPQPLPQPIDAMAVKLLEDAKALRSKDVVECKKRLQDIATNHGPAPEAKEAAVMLKEIDADEKKADRDNAEVMLKKAQLFEKENPGNFQAGISNYLDAINAAANQQDLRDKAEERIKELKQAKIADDDKKLSAEFDGVMKVVDEAENKHDFDAARLQLQKFMDDHANTTQKVQAEAKVSTLNDLAKNLFEEAQKKAASKDVLQEAYNVWAEYSMNVKDASTASAVTQAREAIKKHGDDLLNSEITKAAALAQKYRYAEAIKTLEALLRILKDDPSENAVKDKNDELLKRKKFHEDTMKIAQDAVAKTEGGIPFEHSGKMIAKWKITKVLFPGDSIELTSKDEGRGSGGETPPLVALSLVEQYKFHKAFASENHAELLELCLLLGLPDEAAIEKKMLVTPKVAPSP